MSDYKEYKNLGIANGWQKDPEEYKKCCELKHKKKCNRHGTWNCYSYYICDECKIYYAVDSSG